MSLNVPIQRTRRGRITALNYSPCGTFLVGGAENGYIWAINPATMIISEDSPLQYSCEKIRQLVFAPDSKLLVFADDEGSVGGQFITFMTNKNLYIQQLPIDGNPFKYMGMFAHPKLLKASRPMKDQLMFCFGEGDHAISMWRMNTVPLIENQKHCGPGLDPFCTLLPVGKLDATSKRC
ncbi:hypothetical protein pipiens_005851 [Culex pipiens pipiens]|uniref:Uncharacterized protein n=1 Tax=Culex pipiens pipiens TaxID=38569 RepID=A0ABD1DVK7_CULPP